MKSAPSGLTTFVIDPSQYPKDPFYTWAVAAWVLVILVIGGFFYLQGSKIGTALAMIMFIAVFPLIFFRRMQTDLVEIHDSEIVIRRLNPSQELLRVPKSTPLTVSFERYGRSRGQTRHPESVWSLNIWDHQLGFPRRTLLALRIAPAAKEELYRQLIEFFKRHGITVTPYNETPLSQKSA